MKPRKLPSGTWFIQTQVKGVRKSFSAPTRAEVVRKATEYKLTASDAPSAPLGALIDSYIDAKRNVLSPTTISRYEQTRRLEFQRLMPVPVRELTSERVQREVNIMAANHSPKTVRNAYGLVTATLALFAPSLHLRVTLPKNRKVEYHIPTTEQVYALLSRASENMTTAIMLAAFCGLRRGEIASLTSEDIEGNMIHVRRTAVYDGNRKQIDKAPKTYSSDRYVPAPAFVVEHLRKKKGRVCPIALNSITRRFQELREKLGYDFRFHDLRHYYASALHAVGVQDEYIMKFGGWKSDAVLKEVYRGTLDDFESVAAQRATSFFDSSANEMLTREKK